MRIMGIDYGAARTGIALSDPGCIIAQGIETIHSGSAAKVSKRAAFIAKQNEVGIIVLGLPKNMNNTLGERAELSLKLADKLRSMTGLEVVMWDERLSTVGASGYLRDAGVRGDKRKEVIDAAAAQIILQSYLEFKNKKGE